MRYFVGFLIAIGLIVLVFILILKAFTHTSTTPQHQIDLNSYATTDAVMQMTIDGPVNSDQQHKEIQISIGQDTNSLSILNGYEGDVQTNRTFPNNQSSFAVFLHALNIAGFTQGNPSPILKDERGYCPTGERFIFEIISGGQDVERWWTSSCGEGNFKGKSDTIRDLFKQQIPNYNQLTEATQLY